MALQHRNKWLLISGLGGVVVVTAALFWLLAPGKRNATQEPKSAFVGSSDGKPNATQEPKPAFVGSSDLLRQTSVLATLDTPIPENRSAIWCLSIQLAWNRLKEDLAKEPIQLAKGQEPADRLNRAEQSADDIAANEFFALAGRADERVLEKIRSGLEEKFPQHTMPPIESDSNGVIAFGYVKAQVQYQFQLFDNPEWLPFKGTDGRSVNVRSFGLPEIRKGDPIVGDCRDQVRVLFRAGSRFAVDLSHGSTPNQLILAKMPRQSTLAATLSELNDKIDSATPMRLPDSATLLVPNMKLRIEHDFCELEGKDKVFLNAALRLHFLEKLFQFIDFQMDRSGASVISGGYAAVVLSDDAEDMNPDHYHFDRPFLVVMKKRGAKHPFLVLWVGSAELLCQE